MKHEFKKGGTYYTLRLDSNPVQVIKCVVTSVGSANLKFTAHQDTNNTHRRKVMIWLEPEYLNFDGKNIEQIGRCIYLNKYEAIQAAKKATLEKIEQEKSLIEQKYSIAFVVNE
jgi:hypothetical protein